jgi:hypothetical protein
MFIIKFWNRCKVQVVGVRLPFGFYISLEFYFKFLSSFWVWNKTSLGKKENIKRRIRYTPLGLKWMGTNYKTNKSKHKIEVTTASKDSPIYANTQLSIMLLGIVG